MSSIFWVQTRVRKYFLFTVQSNLKSNLSNISYVMFKYNYVIYLLFYMYLSTIGYTFFVNFNNLAELFFQ